MISDISNFTLYELALIKGQKVSFCRYKYYDSDFNEGFVIRSEAYYFFVRIKTQIIKGSQEVHYLIVKDFHHCELNDAFTFTSIYTGVLCDLILFKSNNEIVVSTDNKPSVYTENSMLLEFENEERFLIYPKAELFSNTSYLQGTDKILETIYQKELAKSRPILKDERLLQFSEQCESLPAS